MAAVRTKTSMRKRIDETSNIKKQLEREIAACTRDAAEVRSTRGALQQMLRGKLPVSASNSAALHTYVQSKDWQGLLESLHGVEAAAPKALDCAKAVAGTRVNLLHVRQAEQVVAAQRQALDDAVQALQDGAEGAAAIGAALMARSLRQVEPRLQKHRAAIEMQAAILHGAMESLAKNAERQVKAASEALSGLEVLLPRLSEDVELKRKAWSIDVACANVRPRALPSEEGPRELPAATSGECEDPRRGSGRRPGAPARAGARRQRGGRTAHPIGRSALTPEVIQHVRSHVKAAAYVGPDGQQLDVVFARANADCTGQLSNDEVRRALRFTCKISPSLLSDAQIGSLCSLLDDDNSGRVSMSELIAFLGAEPEVSQRTGKSRYGLSLAPIDASAALLDPAAGGKKTWQSRPSRPHRHPLEPDSLEMIRMKIKAAAYGGHGCRDISDIFARFDKDGSGLLEDDEMRAVLRRALRIPPSAVSDGQIVALCAFLDQDKSGAVSIDEVVAFVGEEVSRRTGKPLELLPRLEPLDLALNAGGSHPPSPTAPAGAGSSPSRPGRRLGPIASGG